MLLVKKKIVMVLKQVDVDFNEVEVDIEDIDNKVELSDNLIAELQYPNVDAVFITEGLSDQIQLNQS